MAIASALNPSWWYPEPKPYLSISSQANVFHKCRIHVNPPLSWSSVQRSHNTACTAPKLLFQTYNISPSVHKRLEIKFICLKLSVALTLLCRKFWKVWKTSNTSHHGSAKIMTTLSWPHTLHVLPIVSCAEGDEHDRLGCFGDLLLPVTPTLLPRGSPERRRSSGLHILAVRCAERIIQYVFRVGTWNWKPHVEFREKLRHKHEHTPTSMSWEVE